MIKRPVPRIAVRLASESPRAVVFRRGPSKLVRLFLWDRASDTFEAGPVFQGRIYSERSDISPDGRWLIYFAMAGVKWAVAETGGTWTAISRLPSLEALTLWGQGNTWGGGGMFLSNDSYWLNADGNTSLIRNECGLRRETYGPRLPYRDLDEKYGWVRRAAIREKELNWRWRLRQVDWYGPCTLYNDETGESHPEWQWADWDRHRVVWAEDGRLYAAALTAEALGVPQLLHDFNDPA